MRWFAILVSNLNWGQLYPILCYGSDMSEMKGDVEDAGESMKRGAKKTGNRMEEGAEEAKDKVD